jgi:hypothetical protein
LKNEKRLFAEQLKQALEDKSALQRVNLPLSFFFFRFKNIF